jgi:hypothetical protein
MEIGMAGKSAISRRNVVAVNATILATLAFAAYAIRTGVRNLTAGQSPKDAAGSLWHLVVLSVAAGLLSFAVVEFAKRQSRMQQLFNRNAAQAAFGEGLSFPLETEMRISKPISYAGTIRQVSAQISLQLRQLVQLSADSEVPADKRRLALTIVLGVDPPSGKPLPSLDDRNGISQLDEIQDLLDRRLDIFQIETTQRWCVLLRTLAAITAGLLSAISAWAVSSSLTAILVAAIVGIFVGGPISWVTRDLTRIVERKAQF